MQTQRRDFLKLAGSAALASAALPRLAFADAAGGPRDALVVVFLRGGMDGLNVVVPHADVDYYRIRPRIAIPRPGTGTGSAIDLDGRFGLHPALAPLQALYTSGKLALVQAIGLAQASRSHFECQDRIERASLETPSITDGWVNRHLGVVANGNPFQGMAVGKSVPSALRGPQPVIGIQSIASFVSATRSQRPDQREATLSGLYGDASPQSLTAMTTLDALGVLRDANAATTAIENGAQYPNTTFGEQMADVARLLKADIGLEVAGVDLGGWDHHNGEAVQMQSLLDELARSLVAFATDLGARMNSVNLVTMTEFGRRAGENASLGTDHGAASAMFLMGGGVVGGRVYGDFRGLADAQLVQGDLDVTLDYRTVLAEVLSKRMGNTQPTTVFPGAALGASIGAFRPR